MQNAWRYAKIGAKKYGGKAVEYFAEALKLSWKNYKALLAKKGGKIVAIQDWFLKKEFGHPSAVTQIQQSVYTVKKETAKAYFIEAYARECGVDIVNEFWVPKSVCI